MAGHLRSVASWPDERVIVAPQQCGLRHDADALRSRYGRPTWRFVVFASHDGAILGAVRDANRPQEWAESGTRARRPDPDLPPRWINGAKPLTAPPALRGNRPGPPNPPTGRVGPGGALKEPRAAPEFLDPHGGRAGQR